MALEGFSFNSNFFLNSTKNPNLYQIDDFSFENLKNIDSFGKMWETMSCVIKRRYSSFFCVRVCSYIDLF